uniref:Pecanex-like protein n=1 Tax=Angiostrongylus cantonensis TaxID=6313 RepID=A0A0K0DEY6_ANGCA
MSSYWPRQEDDQMAKRSNALVLGTSFFEEWVRTAFSSPVLLSITTLYCMSTTEKLVVFEHLCMALMAFLLERLKRWYGEMADRSKALF